MNAWYDIGALVRRRHRLALAAERTDSRLFGVSSSPRLLPEEIGVAGRLAGATIAMRVDDEWLLEAPSRLHRPVTAGRGDGLGGFPTSPKDPWQSELYDACSLMPWTDNVGGTCEVPGPWFPDLDEACFGVEGSEEYFGVCLPFSFIELLLCSTGILTGPDYCPGWDGPGPDSPDTTPLVELLLCSTGILTGPKYCPGWGPGSPEPPVEPESPAPPMEPDDPDTDEPPEEVDPVKDAWRKCSSRMILGPKIFGDCMCGEGIASYCSDVSGAGGGEPNPPDKSGEDEDSDGGGDDPVDPGFNFDWW